MSRKMFVVSILLSVMLVLIAGSALAQGGGDPVKGKTLWDASLCKNCHGPNGEGKYAGPLAGTARTADEVIKQVRTPRANMPAFDEKHIADQDLKDILAYMQTLTKPTSFSPITYTVQSGDLPGKVLFNQKRCVACHASDPSGFIKARFTDKGRTVAVADVLKQLRTPFQKMPMFSATQVSDDQAGQVADYMKSLQAAAPAAAPTAAAPAPATLPKSGGQSPWAALPLVLIVAGVVILGVGVGTLALARKRN